MSQTLIKNFVPRTVSLCLVLTALLGLLNEMDSIDTNWTLIFVPLFVCFGLLAPFSHTYVSETCSGLKSNSLLVILVLLYFFIVSLFLFTVFLGLKLDEFISSSWYSVFIPMWFTIFTTSFFVVFMLPGMLDPSVKLQREAWTLLSINIALIVSSILLPTYLSHDLEDLWVALFPLFITLPVCLGFFLHFELNKKGFLWTVTEIEFILYVGAIVLMSLAIANEGDDSLPNSVFFITLLICCGLQIISNELRFALKPEEKQESDSEKINLTGHDLD